MKIIKAGWEQYRAACVPANASEVQLRECRQAFYAGAAILYQTITMSLDGGEDATEGDLQRLQAVRDELVEFGQQLDVRYLKAAGQA